MDTLKLVKPSMDWEEEILAYRQEFLDTEDSADGTASLSEYDNVADWLEWLAKMGDYKTCPKGWVPSSTFLCVREEDQKVVGMIDVRHLLNEFLREYGGHIGYSIRPSERGKGYAKEQLRLALQFAYNRGMPRVIITCDKNNEPSRRTIQAFNGILEKEIWYEAEQTTLERYWVIAADFA